jgi:hypothetical protein
VGAAPRRAEQAQAQAQVVCNERLPKRVGNMVARANCFNAADETYMIPGNADADLLRVSTAGIVIEGAVMKTAPATI